MQFACNILIRSAKAFTNQVASKKILLQFILITFFSYQKLNAQANIVWADSCFSNSFYGKITNEGYSDFSRIHTYSDGDFVLTGTMSRNFVQMAIQRNYAHVMRIDKNGVMLWSKLLGINDTTIQVDLRTYGSVLASNGDIIVLLSINASLLSGNYIVRIGSDGNLKWQRKLQYLDNTLATLFTDIVEIPRGGFLIGGTAATVAVLMKLDENGIMEWRKEFYSGDFSITLTAIAEGSVAYYVAGTGTKSSGNQSGNFIASADKNTGDLNWIKWLKFSGEIPLTDITEYEFDVMKYQDGRIALSGTTSSLYPGTNKSAQVVVYMDEAANILSASRIENTEIPLDVANMFQGSLYDPFKKSGVQFRNENDGDYYVFKLDNNDNTKWAWKIVLPAVQGAKDAEVLFDSSVVVAGFTRNAGNTISAAFLKTSSSGILESCDNQPYSISKFNLDVAVQDIPNIQETVSSNNPSVPSAIDTISGLGYVNWQLVCDHFSSTRISKISGKKNICKSTPQLYSLVRGGNYTAAIDFSVQPEIAFTRRSDSSVEMNFNNNGIYTLYAEMKANCGILKDSLVIQVQDGNDTLSLGPDKELCPQNKITLKVSGKFSSYIWQDGSLDSSYTVSIPGRYAVTVTDACKNLLSDTIDIIAAPTINFNVGGNRTKCNTDTLHIDTPDGFNNYVWTPAAVVPQPGYIVIDPVEDTEYSVIAEKHTDCFVYDTVKIRVLHSPAIHLGNDTSICNDQPIVLHAAQGFESYTWSNGNRLPDNLVTTIGSYSVSANFLNGCISRDTINVSNSECFYDMYVPAAFSPNNDGLNDVFKPVASLPLDKYRFQVFTKWGEKIFESFRINNGWDGEVKAKKGNTNVFVWVCTYQFKNKNIKTQKGTVVLLK